MKRFVYAGLGMLAFANIMLWPHVLKGQTLNVTFFDVKQGDAIFIETGQGHQILIDGGPSNKVVEKIANVLPFWDKSIDLIILTHPDADHITGLVDVLAQYNVENVLWTGVEKSTNIFASWEKALEKEGARIMLARAPQRLVWSQYADNGFMEILYPDEVAVATTKAVNDTSVISRLVLGNHSFLFPGDITKLVEQRLVDQGVNVRSNVLKVPHHGSKSSSSAGFLAAVASELAVIHVDAQNRYGHPHQEVLDRFADLGISVLRSDLNGDILIKTNGNSIDFNYR